MTDPSRGFASDHAYLKIRDQIITTALKPCERIVEKTLMDAFGISRTPVREALMRLRYDGLVDILAQRGTYVAPIRPDVVSAAHYARAELECALVRDAARRCHIEHHPALEHSLDHQRLVVNQGRAIEEMERLDETFHQQIAEIAGQPGVWQMLHPVQLHINRARTLFLSTQRAPALIDEHAAIVDAIVRNDEAAADAAMRHHLAYMAKNIEKLASDYADYRG
ncbi:GntR family transcriptional regulator [Salinicola halophilus]|uniref:GntR family transcriptional regulator n=1 Tax=Salinicola halophilus TaxID=184065 RepID=UPI0013A5FCAD|nr:GntR family transcriptional regulator [Salinicola halophilus]